MVQKSYSSLNIDPIQLKALAETYKIRHKCLNSYYEFFKMMWPTISAEDYVDNWHVEYICNELQIVAERVFFRLPKLYDLIINVSPGESKTSMCVQLFPVWCWIKDQTLKVISGSHDMTLSLKNSMKSRDCLKSKLFNDLFGYLGIKFKRDQDNKKFYANTKGGERISCSVGSSIIGSHAHIHIIDDPIDPKAIHSEKLIAKANNWFTGSLSSRKIDKRMTPLVLIMQRLAEEDPTGYILKNYPLVKHICLPATDQYPIHPKELKYNYVNGYMNFNRTGPEVLAEEKEVKSSRDFAAQYGQSPMSVEGNIVKRKYLHVISKKDLPSELYSVGYKYWGDYAYTKKETNDPSGILATKTYNDILYVFDFIKFREEILEAIDKTIEFMEEKGQRDAPIYIENKASGLSITQILKSQKSINAIDYKQLSADKEARLKAVLAFIESGRVVFVNDKYLRDYINMLLMFPNAKHDEEVDTLVMAIFHELVNNSTGQREWFFM